MEMVARGEKRTEMELGTIANVMKGMSEEGESSVFLIHNISPFFLFRNTLTL